MTIPEIREELLAMANRLAVLVKELERRPPIRKAKGKRVKMTPAMRRQIRMLAQSNLRQSDIAARFGISQGRISEVLHGKRT